MKDFNNISEEEKLSQLMDGEWNNGLHAAESVAAIAGDQALREKWARYHMIRDAINGEPVHTDQTLVSRICAAIDDEPAYSNVHSFNGVDSASESTAVTALQSNADVATRRGENSEPSHQEPAASDNAVATPSWVNTGLVGFALAASVALVTVVGLNVFETQGAPDVSTVAINEQILSTVIAENSDNSELQNLVEVESAVASQSNRVPDVELVANTGSFWVSPESSERVASEERLNMMLSQHIENSPTAVREGLLPYSRLVGYEEVEKQP